MHLGPKRLNMAWEVKSRDGSADAEACAVAYDPNNPNGLNVTLIAGSQQPGVVQVLSIVLDRASKKKNLEKVWKVLRKF